MMNLSIPRHTDIESAVVVLEDLSVVRARLAPSQLAGKKRACESSQPPSPSFCTVVGEYYSPHDGKPILSMAALTRADYYIQVTLNHSGNRQTKQTNVIPTVPVL